MNMPEPLLLLLQHKAFSRLSVRSGTRCKILPEDGAHVLRENAPFTSAWKKNPLCSIPGGPVYSLAGVDAPRGRPLSLYTAG
ncbi:unnamed protein product [Nezara viridula]|uniref:Uncharacterized protein n=1 Tax=Nezara viridula TaxID=85310 RepID=A0A9P0HD48_NEZVI|nr:unnamed protein product [Nezara viridula]